MKGNFVVDLHELADEMYSVSLQKSRGKAVLILASWGHAGRLTRKAGTCKVCQDQENEIEWG